MKELSVLSLSLKTIDVQGVTYGWTHCGRQEMVCAEPRSITIKSFGA
jgi:hypothetical protein